MYGPEIGNKIRQDIFQEANNERHGIFSSELQFYTPY